LRALLRLADFALRSLARPCTFDPFLRLAMIGPLWLVCVTSYPQGIADQTTNGSLDNLSNEFSKRKRWRRACDEDHSAPNASLLCSHCTVRPRAVLLPRTWGSLMAAPIFIQQARPPS
jgi:hypothetical protein